MSSNKPVISRRTLIAGGIAISGMAASPAIAQKVLLLSSVPGSQIMSQRLFVEPYSNISSNNTFASLFGIEADFDLVQLIYENWTATPYTISAASVAPSASANDGYNPLNGSGVAITATIVTFNNAGADSPPAPTAGSTTTVSVPAGASNTLPNAQESRVFSDWMSIQSLPRTDGGTKPLLMVRSYSAAGAPVAIVATPTAKLTTDWPTIDGGHTIQTYFKSGNCIATPANFVTPTGPAQYLTPHAVRFYSRTRGVILLTGGDSQTQGKNSTSNHNGFGLQTVKAMSLATRPMSLLNLGYSSQLSATFYANTQKAIDDFKPTIVTIPVMSPNDTQDQATADIAWAAAQALYAYAISKGVAPILLTQIPYNLTSTTDAFRIGQNVRVRASGLRYADVDAALTDGATPARVKSPYNSGDNLHPNDAGYLVMSVVLQPVVKSIIH